MLSQLFKNIPESNKELEQKAILGQTLSNVGVVFHDHLHYETLLLDGGAYNPCDDNYRDPSLAYSERLPHNLLFLVKHRIGSGNR
jgi:hypothetical protein